MTTGALIGTGVIVLLGSLIQRVTGMGLALVASPFLVLVLGADLGVQTIQAVGLGVCALSAWQLRASVSWRKAAALLVFSVIGLVPGAWVARALPAAWLSIVIGAITVLALVASTFVKDARVFEGTQGLSLSGVLSGFMNVTAGVGGPPIVIYASTTRWAYAEYVATVQLYFTGLNVLSLAGRGVPGLDPVEWVVVAGSAVLGLLIGHRIGSSISERVARPAIFVVALLGALATVARGVSAL